MPTAVPEKIHGGFGSGDVCAACDDPILPAQVEYRLELPGGRILRLHIGCAGLSQAELIRRGVRRAM